jgi:chaperone required for assembly of F1-ATPase
MSEWKPKRFWKTAAVRACAGGFEVALDARPVRTPAKSPLILPTQKLAEALAAEWEAQETEVDPETMPLTRLANSAVDKVSVQHGAVADMLAEYGGSDLLCYRAQNQPALAVEQEALWGPALSWAQEAYGIRLVTQSGVMPAPQSTESLRVISRLTHALTPFRLTAFHELVSLPGSWVLGYAVLSGAMPASKAWEAACLDEIWQARQWGADDEAVNARQVKETAFYTADRFARLVEDTSKIVDR